MTTLTPENSTSEATLRRATCRPDGEPRIRTAQCPYAPQYISYALWSGVEHDSRTTGEVLTSAERYLLCHGAFLEKKEVLGCVIHRKRTSGSGDSVWQAPRGPRITRGFRRTFRPRTPGRGAVERGLYDDENMRKARNPSLGVGPGVYAVMRRVAFSAR